MIPWVRWYLAAAGLFGTAYVFLLAPGFGPDEAIHYLRSLQLSHGSFHCEKRPGGITWAEIPTDSVAWLDDTRAAVARGGHALTEGFLRDAPTPHTVEGRSVSAGCAYPYTLYVPHAAGLFLGRRLGLSIAWQFYFARWIVMLAFSLVVALAIALAPTGAEILFFAASVPTALQAASTFTVDTVTLPFALLLTSLILRLALASRSEPRGIESLGVVALTVALSAGKTPYGLIGIWGAYVLWLRGNRDRVLALAVVAGYLLATRWNLRYAESYMITGYPGPPVSAPDQVRFLLDSPFRFLLVLARTVSVRLAEWFGQLYVLGYLDVFVAPAHGLSALAALLACVRWSPSKLPSKSVGIVGWGVGLGISAAILLALYLLWSPVGSSTVLGVQGRYFLPHLLLVLLPLVYLARVRRREPIASPWLVSILYLTVTLALAGGAYQLARRYWLMPTGQTLALAAGLWIATLSASGVGRELERVIRRVLGEKRQLVNFDVAERRGDETA